jgi:hypothetical protein
VAVVTAYTPSPALSTPNDNPGTNFRVLVQLAEDSRGALRVRFKAGTGSGGALIIVGASFGKWNGGSLSSVSCDTTTTPFRLTFGGANGTTILQDAEGDSDFILHPGETFSSGDWVLVSYYTSAGSGQGNMQFSSGHTTALTYFRVSVVDYSQVQSISTHGATWSESGSAGQPGNAGGRNFGVVKVETSTIWDENTFSGGTLSYDRLVFTDNSGTGTVISTTTKSSDKKAAKVTFNAGAATGASIVGVTTTSSDVTGTTAASYMLVYSPGSGYCILNNSAILQGFDNATTAPTGLNDVVTVLLDRTANKLYFQVNGNNVFGADPVAGTGGATVSASSFFIGVSTATATITATADFSPTSLPSGWTAWDDLSGGGPGTQTLTPSLYTDPDTFYAPFVDGPPTWLIVGISEAAINASGNYTLTEPAGCQAGDILIADFAIRSTVIYTNASFTFPQSDSGGNTTNNTTASDTSFLSGYHIRGGSAPTLVFSRTGGSRALGTMRAYRSSRPGTPSFDTSAKLAMTVAGTALSLSGGITTAEDRELITTAVALARAGATTAQSSAMDGVTQVTGNSGAINTTITPVIDTWTERSDRGNTTSPTVALALYDVVKSGSGSTGNLTATAAASALHGMVAMAFKHPPAPQTLTPGLYTDADTFYAPTVSGSGAQTLTPGLYTDADTFYAPTVTRGTVTLTPSLFTATNTFYAPTVTATYSLTPARYDDADTFYGPTVAPGAVTLTPALYTDADTFYAATVTRGTVTLTPGLYTDADTFYAPTVAATYSLTPGLYTDADTFYAPTVTPGAVTLTPGLYTDADTFYAAIVSPGAVTLTPGLYTDADTFYAATVTLGGVNLLPGLYTDADTFYAPTVTAGAVTLSPSLYTDADTFYAATVAPGAVTLTPSLYTDADTFYAPTVSVGAATLTPSLYTDADTFYAATVTPGAVALTPSLYTDADTFYSATVTQGTFLQPTLYTDPDTFYAPTVTPGAVALTPSLYTDPDTFYAATVTPGAVSLAPPLYTDPDTFYGPTVAQGTVLLPGLFTNSSTFYAATVTPGAVALTPALYTDPDVFYSPTLLQAVDQFLLPPFFIDDDTFYAPAIFARVSVIYRKDVRVEYFNVDPAEGVDFTSIEETYAWIGTEATKYVEMEAGLALIAARLANTGRVYDNHTMTSTPYDGVNRRYYIQATYRITPPAIVPLNPNNLNGGGRRRRPF